MPNENENIFSGIPGLDQPTEDLQSLLNAQTEPTNPNEGIPAALIPNPTEPSPTTPPDSNGGTQTPQMFTSEQVAQIIANLKATQSQPVQPAAQPSSVAPAANPVQPQVRTGYTPQQVEFITKALSSGYTLEQIQAAMNASKAPAVDPISEKVSQIEQYLKQQQYKAEENAFISKMTEFGNKYGLSENDLVIFGNKAMEKGINLVNVSDVELVFKALYPEQYAIRLQRMSNTPTSQIYGGSSVPEAPRAAASKVEDAYVENFLKHSMPNQYGMFKK